MVYLTGDTHGNFFRIMDFCINQETSLNDTLVILGDAGINYYKNKKDVALKKLISHLPITLLCVHGNHELRPYEIEGYSEEVYKGGIVWCQPEYPNIKFAKDGQVYNLDGKQCLVIGGAYSVDKYYRLEKGYNWFESEQPNDMIKQDVEDALKKRFNKIDVILSHTCPFKYEPIDMFLPSVDQSTVDSSTEKWLDKIEETTDYKAWYCGHWHIDRHVDKIHFLLNSYECL